MLKCFPKSSVLLLGFVVFGTISFAQPPGYLGKHLIVGYDIFTFPVLGDFNSGSKKAISEFNIRHEFNADYITCLNRSYGINVYYLKTSFDFKRAFQFEYVFRNNLYGYYGKQTERMDYSGASGQITALAVGLHTHIYFQEQIAPLGYYFKPELVLININPTFDTHNVNIILEKNLGFNNDISMITHPDLGKRTSYRTLTIGATIGNHYVILNRFVFDIGFQFGWVLGSRKIGEWNEAEYVDSRGISERNYVSVNTKSSLMSQYVLNINAGLGILIF